MKSLVKKTYYFIFLLLIMSTYVVSAHSGRTDANGGHWDRKAGTYHYHNGGSSSSVKPKTPQNNSNSTAATTATNESTNKINELSSERDSLKNDNSKLQTETTRLKQNNDSLSVEINTLKESIKSLETTMEESIKSLESTIEELKIKNAELEDKLSEYEKREEAFDSSESRETELKTALKNTKSQRNMSIGFSTLPVMGLLGTLYKLFKNKSI